MELPAGLTEAQVLDAIENAATLLAQSFTFGIYDVDDIKQEARYWGLEALPRYDPRCDEEGKPTRPLDNFLYSHILKRLINLKRNKLRRNDAPCLLCHHGEGTRSNHPGGEFCHKYLVWKKRNDDKANIMRPQNIENIADERESNTRNESEAENNAELNEVVRMIDEQLDVSLRATYLQMVAGKSVPKSRRMAVEKAIRGIVRVATGREEPS